MTFIAGLDSATNHRRHCAQALGPAACIRCDLAPPPVAPTACFQVVSIAGHKCGSSVVGLWYDLLYAPRAVLDAGGNCGLASRVAARLWPDATVVTLEPDSDNFAVIQKNFEGIPNLHAEKVGISALCRQFQFSLIPG